jgi:hypothetical protein
MEVPMAFLAMICATLLSAPAQAGQNKKIDLRPTQEKPADPGSATPLLYNTKPVKSVSRVKAHASCTDSMGMIQKPGDAGFESCLRDQDPKPGNPNQMNPKSVGFSIGR